MCSLIGKGLVLLLCAIARTAFAGTPSCRSNATHVAWRTYGNEDDNNRPIVDATEFSMIRHLRRRLDVLEEESADSSSFTCTYQLLEEAQADAMTFLSDHIMAFDLPKFHTLGFVDKANDVTVDGLGFGLVGPSISLSLEMKRKYFWTDVLTRPIFYEYVLNYANLNEARSDWRQFIYDTIYPANGGTNVISDTLQQVEDTSNEHDTAVLDEVVKVTNGNIWSMLSRDPSNPIKFKSGQTPLIFDPMSVMNFGFASCSGMSILFASILRTVGIAARVVGTPAWHGDRNQGNHNWVEVYDYLNDRWLFLEPMPDALADDYPSQSPCTRWFCNPAHMGNGTKVYAAKLKFDQDKTYVPLAWEWTCHDVPGIDRTQYYTTTCAACR